MGTKIRNEQLVTTPSLLRAAGESESGNPLFRGYGIVFGGRDLYGDTFSPPRSTLAGDDPDLQVGTDYFLREIADEVDFETGEIKGALPVPIFWDHGRGIFGSKRFGKAVPIKVTEEGIEYILEIEKKRAEDYQAMIDELMELGYLGLSTQTLRSFVDFDWGTDEIKGWLPAEISLTVTPAEHRTRDAMEEVKSLFKKYNIEVKSMPEDVTTTENDTNPARAVDEIFDNLESDMATEAEQIAQNEVLASVIRNMELINEQLTAINERLERTATTEEVAELRQDVETANEQYIEAVRTFGTRVGEVMRQQTRSTAANLLRTSSEAELDALREADTEETSPAPARTASGYRLPANAPGQ
jgi:hypothetical protein